MKYLLTISCFLLLISCDSKKVKLKKPSFLLGEWNRINDTDSLKTYETWQNNFSGIGLTLKGKDTTFFEKMTILEKNNFLFLEISGVNETPTRFTFTSQTDTSFVCENPKNKFPKKIKYSLDNKQLKAVVSNANFNIEFIFEKRK
jgi:hypothetical protein